MLEIFYYSLMGDMEYWQYCIGLMFRFVWFILDIWECLHFISNIYLSLPMYWSLTHSKIRYFFYSNKRERRNLYKWNWEKKIIPIYLTHFTLILDVLLFNFPFIHNFFSYFLSILIVSELNFLFHFYYFHLKFFFLYKVKFVVKFT